MRQKSITRFNFLEVFVIVKKLLLILHFKQILLHTGNKNLDQNYKTKGKKDFLGLGSNQVPLGYEASMLPLHHESRRWLGKKSLDVNHVD